MEFCIAITTHQKRFELFKKTLNDFRAQTSAPIFVSVNGNYDTPMEDAYRIDVLNECLKYQRVYPTFYGRFRGLAKIWNDQICHSGHEDIIITNDDVIIKPGFVVEFLSVYEQQNPKKCLKVNGAFSTFFINKSWIEQCGYFDEEHYLGIGWEDTEFVHRCGEYPHITTDKYVNLTDETKGDLGEKSVGGKYSVWNRNWFNKHRASRGKNFRPFEKFYDDHYATFWHG